jgi:hypothetical protein
MTQHERKVVGQKQLEVASFDFGVQQVQARGVELDQNIIIPNFRLWHFGKSHRAFLAIPINDEVGRSILLS